MAHDGHYIMSDKTSRTKARDSVQGKTCNKVKLPITYVGNFKGKAVYMATTAADEK